MLLDEIPFLVQDIIIGCLTIVIIVTHNYTASLLLCETRCLERHVCRLIPRSKLDCWVDVVCTRKQFLQRDNGRISYGCKQLLPNNQVYFLMLCSSVSAYACF